MTGRRRASVRAAEALIAQVASTQDADPARALGAAFERSLGTADRSAGAHYTPHDVARHLAEIVIGPVLGERPRPAVWDPACGAGAFLLAAADVLADGGVDPAVIVEDLLWGTDIDPGAVLVADTALRWWAAGHGVSVVGTNVVDADALLAPAPRDEPFEVILGNPPFQSQLRGANVRSAETVEALRARWGHPVVRAYTDTAAIFLVLALRALAPGGTAAMVLPLSVLGARDAAGARVAAENDADLVGLWVAGEAVFGADVDVAAVVLTRRPRSGQADRPAPVANVQRWVGRRFEEIASGRSDSVATSVAPDPETASWAPLALAGLGVPDPEARSAGHLGDIVTFRSGFRDEYYGLVGHVIEAPGEAAAAPADPGLRPLVTSGLIEPGRCVWGERTARFAGQAYLRPAVDAASLARAGGRAAAWVRATSVAKVVVASQTRVGEAAVDHDGRWVASTPTVALLAPATRLWEIAAVVCSPVGTVAALAATAGTARTHDAIRQSGAGLSRLPLPVDGDAWRSGADALRTQDRPAFLEAMAAAYCVSTPGALDEWWLERVPW